MASTSGDLRRADDPVDLQVGIGTGRRPDADGLVGQLDVEAFHVRFGVNGNGLDAEFTAGPHDAQGDLATVGDQDFVKHSKARGEICRLDGDESRGREVGRTQRRLVTSTFYLLPFFTGAGTAPGRTARACRSRRRLPPRRPEASALISFITFMASMMQITVSSLVTVWPTLR